MSSKRYTEEFKVEAVRQITERGHPVAEVASRLGVTTHSLYAWLKKYSTSAPERQVSQSQEAEIRQLKAVATGVLLWTTTAATIARTTVSLAA